MSEKKCDVCGRKVRKAHSHAQDISVRISIDDEFRALEARIRKEMQAVDRVLELRTQK